jgi:hypothetical protein
MPKVVNEWDLFMRRITRVVQHFDEEREIPWEWVERSGDGRFVAVTCVLIDGTEGEPDTAREYSLGIFDSEDAAVGALRDNDRFGIPGPDFRLGDRRAQFRQ